MMNFKNAKENAMNKVGNHSTLITFIFATIGVAATAYLASKEIPKAKAEVKEILAKEDLTKKQKATSTVKVVAKNTWKTGAVAIATILLVTGTAAITAANTATTVAGLTNIANIYEQKLKDTNAAIEELPEKAKEEVKRNVSQKVVNRATTGMKEAEFLPDEACPDKYIWVSKFDGVKFKATFQMVESLEDIVDARITNRGYITIEGVYDILVSLGAEILTDEYPEVDSMFGWNGGFELAHSVTMNENGYTIHYIDFSEPTRDF